MTKIVAIYFLCINFFFCHAMNHLAPQTAIRPVPCGMRPLVNVLQQSNEPWSVLEYTNSYVRARSSSRYPAFSDQDKNKVYCLFGRSLLLTEHDPETNDPIDPLSTKVVTINLPIAPALLALHKTRNYLVAVDNAYRPTALVYSFATTAHYILDNFPVLEGSFLPQWGFQDESTVIARANMTEYRWDLTPAL